MRWTKSHWVFAYGSNMHLPDLRGWFARHGRALRIEQVEVAELPGHTLIWDYYSRARQGGAANITRRAQCQVWGAALRTDGPSLHGFDRKEGHPRAYCRQLIPIRLRDGRWVHAWVYRVTPAYRRSSFVAPTRHYLQLLRGGAEALRLPSSYRAQLSKTVIR